MSLTFDDFIALNKEVFEIRVNIQQIIKAENFKKIEANLSLIISKQAKNPIVFL